MSPILVSIFGFILAIGILVIVHESGHFWVARFFGIRVLRFSVGFGRRLFHWFDKSGTEYVIASIPLGGYVALLGEKKEQPLSGSEHHEAYCYKPVWIRMLVLLAGPSFNLLFAFLAYWLMFIIGITSMAPVLGNLPKGSIAQLAGLQAKQEIISIDNKLTPSWEKVSIALMDAIGNEQSVEIQVREKDQPLQTHILDLSSLEKHGVDGDIIKEMGFVPLDPFPAIIGRIVPETPAAKAELQPGDRIVGIDGHSIHSRMELNDYVQNRAGEHLQLQVERGNEKLNITIQPTRRVLENGKTVGFIGIEYLRGQKIPTEYVRLEKYGVLEASWQALKRSVQYTLMTFEVMKKMLVGTLSVKQISGPIAIAQYAGYTVTIGFEHFLSFLAIVSIGLGVMNILPIPLLDGGQLMYCLWEAITGRAVSEHAQKIGVMIGGGILLALTFVAFYNDIIRLLIKD